MKLYVSVLAAGLAISACVTADSQVMSSNARSLFTASMGLADGMYEPSSHLLRVVQPGHLTGPLQSRESAYYAFGLLLRDGPGDRQKAEAILNAVLALQYTDPSTTWYGTFRVVSTEPTPQPGSSQGHGYDANWREFVGTTFEMVLQKFPDRISPALRDRLNQSIDLAVAGEEKEGRLNVYYTNPALMYGSLWDYSATRRHDTQDEARAVAFMQKLYSVFKQHDAFAEYNSPTYYGVDMYGIVLWREVGSTPQIRSMGSDMEGKLWSSIANEFSSGLRNLAGPYDRAYGMDMTNYVTISGLWIRMLLPANKAPLPEIRSSDTHYTDAFIAPLLAVFTPQVPPAALAELRQTTTPPHMVTQVITDRRTATSWVDANLMFGAEVPDQPTTVNSSSQFRPVTIHWNANPGTVGYLYLSQGVLTSAKASPKGVVAQVTGDITFTVSAPMLSRSMFTTQHWNLPGLELDVTTDGSLATAVSVGSMYQVTYKDVHQITLTKH